MAFRDWGVMNSYRIAKTYIFESIKELYAIAEAGVEHNPDPIFDTVRVGTAPNDYEVDADGVVVLHGDATVWTDVATSLIGRRLFSNTGTIDYDYEENAIVMSRSGDITDDNDRVIFNIQMPHEAKLNSTLKVHMHWEQTSADLKEFTTEYRVQSNGDPKNTTWTRVITNSVDNSALTWTSGTLNQITSLADVDLTGAGLSAVVQLRMTRSDTVVNDQILATFIDCHYESDGMGSREEYTK